jgi:hypothetical protein
MMMRWSILYSFLGVMIPLWVFGQADWSPRRVGVSDTNFVADVMRVEPKRTPATQMVLTHHLTEQEQEQVLTRFRAIHSENLIRTIDHFGNSIALLSYLLYRDAPDKYQQIPKAIRARIAVSWLMNHDKDLWGYPAIQQTDSSGVSIQLQLNDFLTWLQAIGKECVVPLKRYLELTTPLKYLYSVEGKVLTYQLDLQIRDLAYVVIQTLLHEDSKLAYRRGDRDIQIMALQNERPVSWTKRQLDTHFVTRLMHRVPFYMEEVIPFYGYRLNATEIQRALDTLRKPDWNEPQAIFAKGLLLHLIYRSDSTQLSILTPTLKAKLLTRWMIQGSKVDMRHWGLIEVERDSKQRQWIRLDLNYFQLIQNIGTCCIPELKRFLNDKQVVDCPDSIGGGMTLQANALQIQTRDFAYVLIRRLLKLDARCAYDRKERNKQIALLKRELDTTFIDCK